MNLPAPISASEYEMIERLIPIVHPSSSAELLRFTSAHRDYLNDRLDFRSDSVFKSAEQIANGLAQAKTEAHICTLFGCSNADSVRRALERLLKSDAAQRDTTVQRFLALAHRRAKEFRPNG